MSVTIHVNINNPALTAKRIANNNQVGIFTAETWARYFNPYVPMRDGFLSQGYNTEPFKVIYNQPYAHKMHEGDNFNFSHEQHPLATSHWEKPAFSANKNKVANEITEFIKRLP